MYAPPRLPHTAIGAGAFLFGLDAGYIVAALALMLIVSGVFTLVRLRIMEHRGE